MPPLLSICIPTFNRSRRLNLLLQSLVKQISEGSLEEQVEIAISDNASTDGTGKIGEHFASLHPYIRYSRNPWNIGGEPNFVRAVTCGTGTFVWVLGDDDRIREGGIAHIVTRLIPGVTQLFLNFRCVDPMGNCLIASRFDPDLPDQLPTLQLVKRVGFMSRFALISSHVFHRQMFLRTDPDVLLKISPWYVLNTGLLIAFHDQPCHLVREPVLDYTVGNERLPPETAIYNRVLEVLKTLVWLENNQIIDADFLHGCYEIGARDSADSHYFREELYGSLMEISGFWLLPGREDWQVIRKFIDRGPGFWGVRHRLREYFACDFNSYRRRRKPLLHFWHGRAWFPAFSLLLSTDDQKEAEAFDQLMGRWPEEFAHESILVSRLPEDLLSFEHLDVFMAPYRPHRSPAAALNSGFRKALGARVFVLDQVGAAAMPEVIRIIDDWQVKGNAPNACLLFASAPSEAIGLPAELLGLYLKRNDLIHLGGFENHFDGWSRRRLLADAGFRLSCEAWTIEGGRVSAEILDRWFAAQLPAWLRLARKLRKRPFSEHGLNITLRGHLEHLQIWDD